MSERIQHNDVLQETEELIRGISDPGRALPAIKLHIINFIRSDIGHTNEEYEVEIRKMQELADKERQYKENDKIPTIGTELEVPLEWVSTDTAKELNALGIHNEQEPHHDHLWEINQDWSYSYSSQARAIEEARKAGILKEPDSSKALSLHVNFGVPKSFGTNIKLYDNPNVLEFVNASAAAYSSVKRLGKRKTTSTYSVKEDAVSNDKTGYFRFEIRPHEFKDKQAYKMLFELQMLTAGLFAFSKDKFVPNEADNKDRVLSKKWQEFIDKCNAVFDKFGIKREDLPDTDYAEQMLVMEKEPEFVEEIRNLFSTYAGEIRDVIFDIKSVGDADSNMI